MATRQLLWRVRLVREGHFWGGWCSSCSSSAKSSLTWAARVLSQTQLGQAPSHWASSVIPTKFTSVRTQNHGSGVSWKLWDDAGNGDYSNSV